MTPPTPYRNARLYVCSEQCSTCVFRPGNLMSLNQGRLALLVKENLEGGSALTCHATIYEPPYANAICRGFFDRLKDRSPALSLADDMGIIEFISPPSKDE